MKDCPPAPLDLDSFTDACGCGGDSIAAGIYTWFTTILHVLHSSMWIVFAILSIYFLAARQSLAPDTVLAWSVGFTASDVVFHILRGVSELIYECGYESLYAGYTSPPSYSGYVRSKRSRPYMVKLLLGIAVWYVIWKQYSFVAALGGGPVDPGTLLYGRYMALALLMFFGGIDSIGAITSATWYYLFQRNYGIMSKNFVPLPAGMPAWAEGKDAIEA